ncbi:MAG: P-loop NTPase family protein [Carboxydocellales bacterium]
MSSVFGSSRGMASGRIQAATPNLSSPPRSGEWPQERQEGDGGSLSYRIGKARLDAKTARDKYTEKVGEKRLLESQRDAAIVKHAEAQKSIGNLEMVQVLLQKTSDYARQQAKTRFEEVVSEALNVVYGGNHSFVIDLVVRSDRPEVDWYLDGRKLEKPDYDRGGGKIDIITLALRLAILELRQEEGPLMLDEIGKHVDAEAAVNLAYFLHEYSRRFERQIILITHNEALAGIADIGLKVTQQNNRAKVTVYGGEEAAV